MGEHLYSEDSMRGFDIVKYAIIKILIAGHVVRWKSDIFYDGDVMILRVETLYIFDSRCDIFL